MNFKRLNTLISKERKQLLRDPYSIFIGITLPLIMLLCFGYAMSMDIKNIRLGIVAPESSAEIESLCARFAASKYFKVQRFKNTAAGVKAMQMLKIDSCIFLPQDFSRKIRSHQMKILIAVNAVNTTQAQLSDNYIKGILSSIVTSEISGGANLLQMEYRMWYNDANDSRYYMIPGVIVIIMSLIGTFLTALVMAKEYEHGNLESMFVTPMTNTEILLAKAVNNFILGFIGLLTALAAAYFLFKIPFRGNLIILLLSSSVYLFVSLALGLLISSIAKNQFLASQIAMLLTFLPALLLSGFIYEIDNMPKVIQYITFLVPARYYIEMLQCLFLVGNVHSIIWPNLGILCLFAMLFMGLAKLKNPKSLEG